MTADRTNADPMAQPLKKLLDARRVKMFERNLGATTVGDLLRFYPRRYQKRGELTDLADLALGDFVSVLAEVAKIHNRQLKERRGTITEVVVTDGKASLALTFFNQHKLERRLRPGQIAMFSGKVSEFRGKRQLAQPEFELLSEDADALEE